MSNESIASPAPILLNGQWQPAHSTGIFSAMDPATGTPLPEVYPISEWTDLEIALDAANEAFPAMNKLPASQRASFLREYANRLEANAKPICEMAAKETGLPFAPRLSVIELGRTCGQLRQAADAVEDGSWRNPVIDADINLRSVLEPLGPVAIFGPNNFPLAFNGISGGDFTAAIAAGNPVIAKAHPLHPTTSRLLAECAVAAADATGMPAGIIQMVYAMSNDDGLRLVRDKRLGAVAFTGSRKAGTILKAAADEVGKPIYLEMSSVNPVVILPGALEERYDDIVNEMATSGLMAVGQFCTNPGLVVLQSGEDAERFIGEIGERYTASPCGTLLSEGVRAGMEEGIEKLLSAGASLVVGGGKADREGCAWSNTLMRVDGARFLAAAESLQAEVFGNATLIVVADSVAEITGIIDSLEGNLTGCIYSAFDGRDDASYDVVVQHMRPKVGRLLNDKMPTGVAVSPAMNHGGPFPASGHPNFTAVGIPSSLRRFTALACYDNVRHERLPEILRDKATS